MTSRIRTECINSTGEDGQRSFQIIYQINTNDLEYKKIEVQIYDEDTNGEMIYKKDFDKNFYQINDRLEIGKLGENHFCHLLRVQLIVDDEMTDWSWTFFGKKVCIGRKSETDKLNRMCRYTFTNYSDSNDISFFSGDVSISLVSCNGESRYDLPFPAFEIPKNGNISFVIPINLDAMPKNIIFKPNVSARYEIKD